MSQDLEIKNAAIDWCLANGVVVGQQGNKYAAAHAPITLQPSPFTKSEFDRANAIQNDFNEIYARIANDEEYIGVIMQELAKVDDFMKQLWELHLKFSEEFTLGIFRSDYIEDHRSNTIKQVEFNTIASSFGGLSAKVSSLHRNLYEAGYYKDITKISKDSLPKNGSLETLVLSLASAHKRFNIEKSAILFIVQPDEKNRFDQKVIEYGLLSNKIDTRRLTLSEVTKECKIDEKGNLLLHNTIVSVCYFRAGYSPTEYGATEWQARELLEKSVAIKCPSIITQLAGSKKVQQILTKPRELLRWTTPKIAETILETFMSIYPLDKSQDGDAAIALAKEAPENYVIKPQREGGGNNIYRGNITEFLAKTSRDNLSGYILMELIKPNHLINTIVREGKTSTSDVVCELGVYGGILWNKSNGEIAYNQSGGYVLRTKFTDSDEGGVAAGTSISLIIC